MALEADDQPFIEVHYLGVIWDKALAELVESGGSPP
jgi:hypothetical protein